MLRILNYNAVRKTRSLKDDLIKIILHKIHALALELSLELSCSAVLQMHCISLEMARSTFISFSNRKTFW